MNGSEWLWKIPTLDESRWKDSDNIQNSGQFDPIVGMYCQRNHNLWLVGLLSRDESGWQHLPYYPTGDGRLILLNRNISPQVAKLHGDQPFAVPTQDLPIDDWLLNLEAGRTSPDMPELSAAEREELKSLPTHEEQHVWMNNKVTRLSRRRLTLRCRFCSITVNIRLGDAGGAFDQLPEAGVREVSLKGLQTLL